MFKKLLKFYLFLSLILMAEAAADNHKYTFRQIKVEDGLSQSTILTILQDKKGYMWFGTGNGLNKFNGYSFVVYSNVIDNPSSISSNVTTSMFEDSRGILWFGTVDGVLNRYNRDTETFTRFNITSGIVLPEDTGEQYYDYPISFSRNNNNSLTTITEDNYGHLWIGTWGKGLIMFDPLAGEKVHFYKGNNNNTLSHNRITKIIKDSFGTLWVGTLGGGLNLLDVTDGKYSFSIYKHDRNDRTSISEDRIISIVEDDRKNIWVGTYTKGFNKVESINGKISFRHFKHQAGKNSLASNAVMSLLQDKLGYLWIGTFGGGLDRFDIDKEAFINFRKNRFDENSLADDDVLTMFEDRSGIIWIGTHLGRGISKLERNKIKFNHLRNNADANSLNDDVVWSVYKDDKDLWTGTYRGGLNRITSDGQYKFYQHYSSDPASISDNHVRSIRKDFTGNLWVGTYSGGLNKLNPSTGKFISYKNDPADKKTIGANQVLFYCYNSRFHLLDWYIRGRFKLL
jgi:ligand-binding sensor domain-containing protein